MSPPKSYGGFERALGIRERLPGGDPAEVSGSLIGLAEVALAQGRPADAVAPAERAVGVREAGGATPTRLATGRLVLARALWAASAGQGGDRERALGLARMARDALRGAQGAGQALAEAEAFLAERGDAG